MSCAGVTFKARFENATYTEVFRATSTADLTFTPTNTARFTLDNVSLKKITAGSLYTVKDAHFGGVVTAVNNITTAGLGVPAIYSAPAISATKTANFTVATYTPPATAGTYRASGVITTTSSTNTGTVQFTLDYKDSQGTTHTADVIPVIDATGTVGATGTGASKEFQALGYSFTIDNSATNIVLKVVVTGTVSYTVVGSIEQLS